MKQIIQRSLPLNVRYVVLDKKYIPVIDGGGCTCDNCGRLIANIATVRSSNGVYNIGFDCLETFLLNNSLLDGFNVAELNKVKRMIAQVIRFSKQLKETFSNNTFVTGLLFEKPSFEPFYPFYYLQGESNKGRDNDYVKLKDMDFNFLIDTLRNIFPKYRIITQ